jgi:DNA polymerase elongation subunit (family B)
MKRPAVTSQHVDRFFLREIVNCRVDGSWDNELWCFGTSRSGNSVSVKVTRFEPSFLIQPPDDVEEWMDQVNETLKPFEAAPNIITRTLAVEMKQAVGFSTQMTKLLRVFYRNSADIYKIRQIHKEQEVDVDGKNVLLELYHDDWSVESQFLFQSGINTQEWVEMKASSSNGALRVTSCQIERVAKASDFRKCTSQFDIPNMYVCSLRGGKEGLIGAHFYDTSGTVDVTKMYSSPAGLMADVRSIDVDVFNVCSDNDNVLEKIVKEKKWGVSKFLTGGDRFFQIPDDEDRCIIYHPGRDRIDLVNVLSKIFVNPKLDSFTLSSACTHPKLIKKPLTEHEYRDVDVRKQANLLSQLEKDNNRLLEFIALARACSSNITAMVSRGQQVRVWEKMKRKFMELNLLANKQLLERAPVIVKRARKDSSFPHPTVKQPKKRKVDSTTERGGKEKKFRNLFGKVVTVAKKKKKKTAPKKKKYSGGYVCEPDAGFYVDPRMAAHTFDFKSLYPSIIRGYRVCFMRLIYDAKYLSNEDFLKKAELQYVSINERECIVLVKTYEGTAVQTFLPEMTDEVCRERTRVKKKMKQEANPFVKSCLNAQQLACKVLQNAIYGFLGVRNNAMFAAPVLMAFVCTVGQYMIKKTRHLIETKYEGDTLYGDTDSVMVTLPHPDHLTSTEEIFAYYEEICPKIAAECTALFPHPNELEIESRKSPFILFQKKMYAALECEAPCSQNKTKLVVKGVAYKKRDRCPWIRRIGKQVLNHLLHREDSKVMPYIRKELQLAVDGQLDMKELTISCLIKPESEYKSENLIQRHVAAKIEERSGRPVDPNTRISYVVTSGTQKLYKRGDDPRYVKKKDIDYIYYLDRQLEKPIAQLLMHHCDLMDQFQKLIGEFRPKMRCVTCQVRSLRASR